MPEARAAVRKAVRRAGLVELYEAHGRRRSPRRGL